jgi:hypothetical protein
MTIREAGAALRRAGYKVSNVGVGDVVRLKNPGISLEMGYEEPAYGWYSIGGIAPDGGLTIHTGLAHPDDGSFYKGRVFAGIEDIITEEEDDGLRQGAWNAIGNKDR